MLKMEWTPIVDRVYDADISVSTEAAVTASTISLTIQLKDFEGNNLTVPAAVKVYLSEVATGLTISTVTLTTDMSASVGDIVIITAYKTYLLVSNASGAITMSISYTTTDDDLYLVVVMPNGRKVVSSKFEFE